MSPTNYVLRTFNAYSKNVASSPDKILQYTNSFLNGPLKENQIITSGATGFTSSHNTSQTAEEVYADFSASVGISGQYGFFSASVQANQASRKLQAATSFNFAFAAEVGQGSTGFNHSASYREIAACLENGFTEALNGIETLQDAANFTEEYGTHIILPD
jgi:hypothetical protein